MRLLAHCSDGFGDQQVAVGNRQRVHIMEMRRQHRDLGEVFPGQSVFVVNVADKHGVICLEGSVKIM